MTRLRQAASAILAIGCNDCVGYHEMTRLNGVCKRSGDTEADKGFDARIQQEFSAASGSSWTAAGKHDTEVGVQPHRRIGCWRADEAGCL